MQYFWRGIHLLGGVWWPYLNDLRFLDSNSTFVGDADIKMEYNGHTTAPVNAWPKAVSISNIMAFHSLGTMNNSLAMIDGSYNDIQNYHIDGTKYIEAPISLTGHCENNVFRHLMGIDLVTPSPDVRKAAIYLNGTGVDNNKFYDVHMTPYPYTVAINSGATGNHLEIAGYWGFLGSINDTGAGARNVIVVNPGPQVGSVAKITTTAALVRIIDERNGAVTSGVSTQSGNASTTAFNIVHGCYTTPLTYSVTPQTADATGTPVVTATSTNLVVTYPVAPPTGTNNLVFVWRAGVY
jgi:hypothetical protein